VSLKGGITMITLEEKKNQIHWDLGKELSYPMLEINLNKIHHNIKTVVDLCNFKGIGVAGATCSYVIVSINIL